MLKPPALHLFETGFRLALIRRLFETMEVDTEELFVRHMVELEECVERHLPDARFSEKGPLREPFRDWTEKHPHVRVQELTALESALISFSNRLTSDAAPCSDALMLGLRLGIVAANGDLAWPEHIDVLLDRLGLERADIVAGLPANAPESSIPRSYAVTESLLAEGTTDVAVAVLDGIQRMLRDSDAGIRPVWDSQARKLTVDGKEVRTLAAQARNIAVILDAFQERGWPQEIDAPAFDGDFKV